MAPEPPELAVPDDLRRRLAAIAGRVHREETELDRQQARLAHASNAEVERILMDRSELYEARLSALAMLLHRLRVDERLPGLLMSLWEDPDERIARQAIQCAVPYDPQTIEGLHRLLDDPREGYWSEAAIALARRKDRAVLPRLLEWLARGDTGHFQVALSGLSWLLDEDDRRDVFRRRWDRGDDEAERRLVLAAALLALGDEVGLPLLEETARRASGLGAAHSASAVYEHDAALGLELMAGVLDREDPETRRAMAEKVAHLAHLPNLSTTGGLAEARNWVEQRRKALALSAEEPA